jgi:hypothetical protein
MTPDELATTTSPERQTVRAAGAMRACDSCGTPLHADQRYCIRCGERRSGAANPAADYLADASRRRRAVARARASVTGRNEGTPAHMAILLALLPVAVGIGVLIGHGGNDNQALLDALKRQKAPVIRVNGGAGAGTATSATQGPTAPKASIASDFPLTKGYTVRLRTLPIAGTTAADASKAKAAATAKGAKAVGILSPANDKITPSQGAKNYVLYSGVFKTRAQANAALKHLKPKFKGAAVIAVAAAGARAGAGKVLNRTKFGVAHQATTFKPTKQKIASDRNVVKRLNKQVGTDYLKAQRNLPDIIVVPDNAGSAPAPTGSGD